MRVATPYTASAVTLAVSAPVEDKTPSIAKATIVAMRPAIVSRPAKTRIARGNGSMSARVSGLAHHDLDAPVLLPPHGIIAAVRLLVRSDRLPRAPAFRFKSNA